MKINKDLVKKFVDILTDTSNYVENNILKENIEDKIVRSVNNTIKKEKKNRAVNQYNVNDNFDVYSYGNKLYFQGVVSSKSINKLQNELNDLNQNLYNINLEQDEKKTGHNVDCIELYISSNGGSLFDGLRASNFLRRNTFPIEAYVYHAFSAATIMALSCKKVFAYENSIFMIHNLSQMNISGNFRELQDNHRNNNMLTDNLYNFYEKEAKKRNGKLTQETLDKLMYSDRYLSAKEAITLGFIDEII